MQCNKSLYNLWNIDFRTNQLQLKIIWYYVGFD